MGRVLYNGPPGEAVGIVFRNGGRRDSLLPAFVIDRPPKFSGHPPRGWPGSRQIARIDRSRDRRRRCSRLMAPPGADLELRFGRSRAGILSLVAMPSTSIHNRPIRLMGNRTHDVCAMRALWRSLPGAAPAVGQVASHQLFISSVYAVASGFRSV